MSETGMGLYSYVYVNTLPSNSERWRVTLNMRDPQGYIVSAELLHAAIDAVKGKDVLLYRTAIPFAFPFTPRYWVITNDNVIGVKRDGTPTAWALWGGYWSPTVAAKILRTLEAALKELEKPETEETPEVGVSCGGEDP